MSGYVTVIKYPVETRLIASLHCGYYGYPTAEQNLVCFILSQNLTTFLLPIFIVRQDERTGNIYILAGEETGIVINRNGKWRYDE
jgi:hypothetical protein